MRSEPGNWNLVPGLYAGSAHGKHDPDPGICGNNSRCRCYSIIELCRRWSVCFHRMNRAESLRGRVTVVYWLAKMRGMRLV